MRSDLLRLLILLAEGGLYCDLNDTECLVPLDRLCDRFSFVVGIDRYNRAHNAVIGSAPGHPLVREVLEGVETDSAALNLRLAGGGMDDHMAAVLETAGPYALSRIGIKPGVVNPGAAATVTINPMKNGASEGNLKTVSVGAQEFRIGGGG